MPQPLSSLNKMVSLHISPRSVVESPLGSMPMHVISIWATLESVQTSLVAQLLKADHVTVSAMLRAIKGPGRAAAVRAAVKANSDPRDFVFYKAVETESQASQDQRHRFAHDIWATSPQVDDALLLLHSRSYLTHRMDQIRFGSEQYRKETLEKWVMEVESGVPPTKASLGELAEFNYEDILIYQQNDFEEAINDAALALNNYSLLSDLFGGFKRLSDRAREELMRQPAVRAKVENAAG